MIIEDSSQTVVLDILTNRNQELSLQQDVIKS